MSFGQPLALCGLLLAIPIVVIHLLRGNLRRRWTSAAFLWRDLGRQTTARRFWRRPPLSLALLLQILALSSLTLASASPSLLDEPGRQIVLLIDASASMQATDVAPSRFDEARNQLLRLVRSLGPSDRVSIIRVGARPSLLVSGSERRLLENALAAVRPGAAPVSLRDALLMANRLFKDPVPLGSEIVFATDGSLEVPAEVGPLSVPVRFIQIGLTGENRGISSLRAARSLGEHGRLSLFAQITNYGSAPGRASVRLAADGVQLETRQLDLPARGRAVLWADLPPEARSASAVLLERDGFALDDQAEVNVEENRRRSVQLVSRSPQAWERALGAIPGLEVSTGEPAAYRDRGADIVVFDNFLPQRLPGGQLIIVNPPPGNPHIEMVGEARDVRLAPVEPGHPLIRSIDLHAFRLVKASVLALPRWGTSVAESVEGPHIFQGELEGRRILVYGFDPLLSGLEKLIVFPLMVANATDYLATSGGDFLAAPGLPLALPVPPDARDLSIDWPDGRRETLSPRDGAARLDRIETVGRHTIRYRLPNGEVVGRSFYVNLFGEDESDIAPRRLSDWPAKAALQEAPPGPGIPLWPAFAASGLVFLCLEWLYFVRKG